MKPDCAVETCRRERRKRDWCEMHYQHWKKYGDPLAGNFKTFDYNGRFDAACEVDAASGCWVWQRPLNTKGYGAFWNGTAISSHRFAYERYVGPVPNGLELDHLCRNRACCNPDHLEAVTHMENMRRSAPSVKTECVRGHPYEKHGVLRKWDGRQLCRLCLRIRAGRSEDDPRPVVPIDEMRRLYESGLSTTQVGKEIGLHASQVSRRLRAVGVEMRPKLCLPKPIDEPEVLRLHDAGFRAPWIAERVGATRGQVQRVLRQNGRKGTPGRPSNPAAAHALGFVWHSWEKPA